SGSENEAWFDEEEEIDTDSDVMADTAEREALAEEDAENKIDEAQDGTAAEEAAEEAEIKGAKKDTALGEAAGKKASVAKADADKAGAAEEETGVEENASAESRKAAPSTGSGLRDAANALLNITPEENAAEDAQAEDNLSQALNEMHAYFDEAAGAQGFVHFAFGEEEQVLTLRPVNNEEYDGARLVTLALLATDSKDYTVAANATTYVNLMDDEEAEAASYEFSLDRSVISAEHPSVTATVRRLSGLKDFTSVYWSTITQTAPEGSYERTLDEEIAFTPGETEKRFTVTGLDFTKGGKFGLRLETLETDAKFNEDYLTVEIQAEDEAVSPEEASKESGSTAAAEAAQGSGAVQAEGFLGEVEKKWNISPEYWNPYVEKPADSFNVARVNGGNSPSIVLKNKDGRSGVTVKPGMAGVSDYIGNGIGVKSIKFHLITRGSHGGITSEDYSTTLSLYNQEEIEQVDFHKVGKMNWQYYGNSGASGTSPQYDTGGSGEDIVWDISGKGFTFRENVYPALSVKALAYFPVIGPPRMGIGSVEFSNLATEFIPYAFSPQESVEGFFCEQYHFEAGGVLKSAKVYVPGYDSMEYKPEIEVKSGDALVKGFYTNSDAAIRFVPKDPERDSAYGLTYKGFYLTSDSTKANDLFKNGRYDTTG
ncbi:MAG: hypothetical protein IJU50_07200, partial [Lachnospiraceae bacterium]|nr:hypothetical protein [Lachnospiraceae bacterium]